MGDAANPTETCIGALLHRTVPAERWCVSRSDLIAFKLEVKRAVSDGRIRPTTLDQFDPSDHRYGPSIYTVNEQFIKPVTANAGNASWALMCNPSGIKCDVFVTHAWQEGLYEFVDKVVNSWPGRAHGAYCCMLSNPQNLDISDLIKTPRTSPFAMALQVASFVLVVPNRNVSIYSRIWCAYEAVLAYRSGKFMFMASRPIFGDVAF